MSFHFVGETMRKKNSRAVLASSVLALLGIGIGTATLPWCTTRDHGP